MSVFSGNISTDIARCGQLKTSQSGQVDASGLTILWSSGCSNTHTFMDTSYHKRDLKLGVGMLGETSREVEEGNGRR